MPRKKKPPVHWLLASWWQVTLLVVLFVLIALYPGQNSFVGEMLASPTVDVFGGQMLPEPPMHAYPEPQTATVPGDEISATSAIILDPDAMVYLYKRNDELSLSPASTTKILTALVSLDHYHLDDVLTVKKSLEDGSQVMGLITGERITVENLLYGALIHSGNDAAFTLAENYPGGLSAFVEAMNRKAKDLHLTESHFTNPAGFEDPTHKMTARDLTLLALAALQNKTVMKMVAIPSITISDVTHTYFHKLTNVNQLLGKIPGVAGIKTGWTEEAGENLVTLVERGGHRLIIVVLHSKDRFGDTTNLISWVFSNFRWINLTVE